MDAYARSRRIPAVFLINSGFRGACAGKMPPCCAGLRNLVPRAHVPFGQHQDTELWNNQFPETKILGLPVSQRMRGLVYLESRGEVDVNTFHKDIQYALERLGKSKFGFERTAVIKF